MAGVFEKCEIGGERNSTVAWHPYFGMNLCDEHLAELLDEEAEASGA